MRNALENDGSGWLAKAFSPLFALSFNWDESQERYTSEDGSQIEGVEMPSNGWELTILNVLSMRRGEYAVQPSLMEPMMVDRRTKGWGVSFDVPGVGGFHFDRSRVELATPEFGDHEPTSAGFWINPLALWKTVNP
jgi:hypothetical protein